MSTKNIYIRRWEAAKALFISLLETAVEGNHDIMFDHTIIQPEQIKISESGINVVFDNCTFEQFTNRRDMDGGLYDTIGDYEASVRKKFFLIKKIDW